MTVIYTTKELDGTEYDYIYSDENRYLVLGDQQWEEVYEPLGPGHTYTEGDPIPEPESNPDELLSILLGGTDD